MLAAAITRGYWDETLRFLLTPEMHDFAVAWLLPAFTSPEAKLRAFAAQYFEACARGSSECAQPYEAMFCSGPMELPRFERWEMDKRVPRVISACCESGAIAPLLALLRDPEPGWRRMPSPRWGR